MRALKLTFALAGLLALGQYLHLYYKSLQFNDFVKEEAQRTGLVSQLRLTLLDKAKEYSLPVRQSDINITTTDGVLRVGVDYSVPFNLLVYSPSLKFRAIGAGFRHQ